MTTDSIPDDLCPVNVAASLLPGSGKRGRISIATVYRWLLAGRLRSWRLGGRRFVSRQEVLSLLVPVPPRPDAKHVPEPTRAQQARETSETLRRFGLG